MMELEQQYTSLYKSQNQFAVKRERTREVEAMACVAEDLSLPSKKLKKSGTTSPSKFMCDKTENSRLPEGTFLKTGVITQVMDIQEPISKLRSLLENHLGIDLSNFQIWLQDKLKMLPHKSLGEQCIQNEGLAQIKVELKQVGGHSRINIIDVLRFPEDCVEADADEDEEMICPVEVVEDLSMGRSSLVEEETTSNETIPSKWTIYEDINSLFPIPLPNDPSEWTEVQIHHWLQWAIQEFKIAHVSETFWNITGKQLCQMSLDEFRRKVPVDPQNHLWTHIELLRKCHIFAVIDKSRQHSNASSVPQVTIEPSITPKVQNKNSRKPRTPSSSSSGSSTNGNRNISTPTLPLITVSTKRPAMTGHNGQIQLWQFLLELLGDTRRKDVIQWVGRDGEFKLNDPELVAQMWGERKNKPKMNYEKLSRALRYYYHDGMIAKVHGRRFVYKFERKLKELIGLSTEELISIGEGEESMKSAEM